MANSVRGFTESERGTLRSEVEPESCTNPIRLPWGVVRERVSFPESVHISTSAKPGEFVLRTLFAEFTVLAEKKIELVLEPPNKEKPLSKLLQRGEDPNFDQLLSSLNIVAENCLPSLLRALFDWYDRQNPMDEAGNCLYRRTNKNKGEKEFLCEKRDLAVDFIYCLVLIEILKQLPYHPGHDDLVTHIISLAFRHFKYREGGLPNPNSSNINIVADLYAEVIGVLAQSRFPAVKKRFMHELRELRNKEQTQHTTHCIISLLMGMKFFRVKMHPIEEFQACIQFLHECGTYFLELKEKDKEIKHALAGLFVEILLPVAAVAKNEVNVPVLKSFVDLMYVPTLDLGVKRRHTLALFPMVTCLLCVSQKQFFLNNWPSFLTQCLLKLRDRDSTTARVALESLYRLLWVYMIRVKCESNTTTFSRLQSIVSSLFPKGTKVIVPKDAPLNIFVKIIQFISQERLDFAMKEIIFDLLGVGKSGRPVYPERMCIGLRAFLVIADGRQQSEGEPPMPQTMGVLPSGSTLRFKKTFINRFLTDQTARNIGLSGYYGHVRKAFDSILRTLDTQVGRPILLIRPEILNRAADDIITGERKPKIDLFRYCIAALPRLLPDGLSQQELIEMLSRLTVHIDDELGKLAFQSLQNISLDLPEWRNDVLNVFIHFILREVTDSFPQLLEQSNRRLIMLLTQWKTSAQAGQAAKDKAEKDKKEKNEANAELVARGPSHQRLMTPERDRNRSTLNLVESLALVMMCSCKPVIRKQAVIVLKEVRNIFTALGIPKHDGDSCVLDMMDRACPMIIEKVLPHLPGQEKVAALSASPVDFQWLTERTSIIWTSGNIYHVPSSMDANDGSSASTPVFDSASMSSAYDSWIQSMTIFLHPDFVVGHCMTAVQYAWPFLFTRLQALVPLLDPVVIMSERSSSLLRSKKAPNERDMHLSLWKNYVVMGCCIAPPSHPVEHHLVSPDPSASSPDTPDHFDLASRPVSPGMTAREMFKSLTTYIKCEVTEMRETAVVGMGHINPPVFRDLVEELIPLIREAIDRKLDTRKKKRRDMIRLSLIHIFRLMAENAIFAQNSADVINPHTEALSSIFIEYIDGSRLLFELEADKDMGPLSLIRLHFSKFVHHLILNTPVNRRHKLLSQDLRAGLCMLFASWSGKFGLPFFTSDRSKHSRKSDNYSELEISALQACAASLCCGTVYDPAGLNEDGYIYVWLNKLLATHDEKIYKLVQETIVLLLEFNHDAQTLLEWVVNRCYTGNHEIADGCFTALAMVFNSREYPCDQIAILNLALLNTGCSRVGVQELAVQLLRLLYKRFFLDDFVVIDHTASVDREDDRDYVFLEEKKVLKDGLFLGPSSGAQMRLSTILAALHPDLTMPMFSEIMHRLVTAQPSVRQNLLQYLVPWLHNMELVDPNIIPNNHMDNLTILKDCTHENPKRPLKGQGWGSPEATNMILNNLFYITLVLGDDHRQEIESLWAELVKFWPGNLAVIVRYVIITVGMYPQILLPCAKKVMVYLARAKPDRLIDELMIELRTAEPLPFNVERMETPPFYRLSKRQMTITSVNDDESDSRDTHHLDKGQIHTKRHSGEDPSKLVNSGPELMVLGSSSVSGSKMPLSSPSLSVAKPFQEDPCLRQESMDRHCQHGLQPHPLPMPAYGGYYASLSELLPGGNLPMPPYHRSNLAVMLLPDLVLDSSLKFDWSIHLPLMLHMLFLGLDNNRPLVHEHCKRLLLSLLLVFPVHNNHFAVAKMIIGNRMLNEDSFLMLQRVVSGQDHTYIDDLNELSSGKRHLLNDHVDNLTTDNLDCLPPVETFLRTDQVAMTLIEFLLTRKCRPLWAYEDITSKVHRIKSAESLEHLLKYVLRVFRDSLSAAHIEQRWAQESIHMALSCSSRHCAGRSFQVFRALRVPLNPGDLSDILSRLVETVAEQGDDMQGYVTEIMLTLEAAVDNFDTDLRPLLKEFCLSTPNLAKELMISESRKMAVIAPLRHLGPPYRSSSCNQSSIAARKAIVSSPPIMENKESQSHRHLSGEHEPKPSSNLLRSQSTQSLKHAQDPTGFSERLTILSQMFWVSVSMMESDFEYEFLLAVRLLDKVLRHLPPDRPECRDKLDKIRQQLCWHDFPGVQALLLKGLTSPLAADPTWNLLSKLTSCISAPVIDQPNDGFPNGLSAGFAMNVIALLPYLVERYDDRSRMCIETANSIGEMCTHQSTRLENLATVMMQYSQGTFAKDGFQWTKCVVKYLYDVYSPLSDNMIAFLVEVLDKGPTCSQGAVLQILHCLVHYVDVTQASTQTINADLLRVVARYVENPHHWKEALKIIKLCVARSSTLVAAPPNLVRNSVLDISVLGLPTQFPQTEMKQALPGRTMDFKFDQSQIPIVGAKYWDIHSPHCGGSEHMDRALANSGGRHPGTSADGTAGSMSTQGSSSEGLVSSWKRPVASQARTRERLVNLLNCYGPRVIPKSPSVVFDQQSPAGTLERASSVTPGTSSDETSTIDGGITGDMQIEDNGSVERQIQSVFDFLEETDTGCEYWGVNQRRSHSLDDEEEPGNQDEPKESSDDETQSTSPVEELHTELAIGPILPLRSHIPLDVSTKNSISGSNQSIHSTCIDIDINEYSPSAPSPLCIAAVPYLQEDIAQAWRSHVNHIMAEFNSPSSVNTFVLFYRLFSETKANLHLLTVDVISQLKVDYLRDLDSLLSSLETRMTELECPLVFADAEAMAICKLNERHRFLLLEINECYETYVMRLDSFENVRSAFRLTSPNSSPKETSGIEQRLHLVSSLYRLNFQFLQLFDIYSKLVNVFVQSARSSEVSDMTPELNELRLELLQQTKAEEQDAYQYLREAGMFSSTELENAISTSVTAHQYAKAIWLAKQYSRMLHDLGAVQPFGDVETILYLYSKHLAESKSGYLAVCQRNTDLNHIYNRLVDIKVQVSASFELLRHRVRSPDEPTITIKHSDSSTL